ncbi:MAG: hypothetical protein ABFD90_05350 [Phycisphaerales bacterium]
MTDEKNLREELLRQNEANRQMADDFRNRILKADQTRVATIRWLVLFAWTLVATGVIAGVLARPLTGSIIEFYPQAVPVSIRVFEGLLVIATLLTIWLHVRSKTLTLRQIQMNLALIEEHLRKMAQKD